MTTYQFNGEHHAITLEGVKFIKGVPTAISSDDEKRLKASGFWQGLVKRGEMVAIDDEQSDGKSDNQPKPKRTKKDEPLDEQADEPKAN